MALMKILAFGLLLSTSANAQLAERFRYREQEAREIESRADEQAVINSAYGIAESIGRSKVVSGPEVQKTSEFSVTWYFRMANRKVCAVPIKLNSDGAVSFAFATSASCVQD